MLIDFEGNAIEGTQTRRCIICNEPDERGLCEKCEAEGEPESYISWYMEQRKNKEPPGG